MKDTQKDAMLKRAAELTADGSDTPLLRKYLGDEEVDKWNMDWATSDERDPNGEE